MKPKKYMLMSLKPKTYIAHSELEMILRPQFCLEAYSVAQSTLYTWTEV